MADTAEPTAKPTPQEQPDAVQQAPNPEAPQPEKGADEGKGSKDAVLADLAKVRAKNHQLEDQFGAFKDAFAKALGLDGEKPLTPEELTSKVSEQTSRAEKAERLLAVTRAMPATVDSEALLDSSAFQKAIADVTPDKVTETVTSFVEQHPRFLRTNPGAGSRDLGEPTSSPTPTDPLVTALAKLSAR